MFITTLLWLIYDDVIHQLPDWSQNVNTKRKTKVWTFFLWDIFAPCETITRSITGPLLTVLICCKIYVKCTKTWANCKGFLMEMFLAPLPMVYTFRNWSWFVLQECCNVDDYNNRNTFFTSKLLKQGYSYHKLCKAFSKFYYRHSKLIVKYNICLKIHTINFVKRFLNFITDTQRWLLNTILV